MKEKAEYCSPHTVKNVFSDIWSPDLSSYKNNHLIDHSTSENRQVHFDAEKAKEEIKELFARIDVVQNEIINSIARFDSRFWTIFSYCYCDTYKQRNFIINHFLSLQRDENKISEIINLLHLSEDEYVNIYGKLLDISLQISHIQDELVRRGFNII